MIQKLKSKLVVLSVLFTLLMPTGLMLAAAPAYADVQGGINNSLKCGSNADLSGTNCSNNSTGTPETSLSTKVADLINIFSAVVGIVAVIMIIYGGFRYVSSGGKQESVTGAKNTILYAIIGLVIVALAQAIVHFVLNKAT